MELWMIVALALLVSIVVLSYDAWSRDGSPPDEPQTLNTRGADPDDPTTGVH